MLDRIIKQTHPFGHQSCYSFDIRNQLQSIIIKVQKTKSNQNSNNLLHSKAIMQQEEAKLVTTFESHDSQKLQFIILNNQKLGSGAFGIVKKAFQQSKPTEELAVKIIPYGDQKSKEVIKKEIEIMKNLQQHPNLVKVLPLQCFSQNNFYIFMEYCNEGTLENQMRTKLVNKDNFTEEEVFKAFYEILSGYKVLWKKKILHQDLKPQNILVKNGTYKITDFGFSIFYEGVKLDRMRQGTCEYMPLQKLTVPNYFASTKSDIFSLGVIFFKMITGRHPFILQKYKDHKQYIELLRSSQLNVPAYIKSRLSMPMQHLFELIIKMVAKSERERIDFDEVYSFMEQEASLFGALTQEEEKFYSVEMQTPKQLKVKFVEVSKALVIPFSIPRCDEDEYEKQVKNQVIAAEQKFKNETLNKIERYLCSMRIMVYFFDRLNRRLIVEKKVKLENNSLTPEDEEVQEKAILALLYSATKLTTQTIEDARYSRKFSPEQWKMYKLENPYVLQLIKKDEDYLKLLTNQLIMETKQSKIADRHRIIEFSKGQLLDFLKYEVKEHLIALLRNRSVWIDLDDKKQMVTLYFILNAIEVIDNFREKNQKWEQLEGFFRQMEMEQLDSLRYKVTDGLKNLGIMCSIDQGGWEDEERNE